MHRTWIEIHEQALVSNIQTLRSLMGVGAIFCAVVKANAYGHGIKEVARIARRANVDAFAVDHIDDALILRDLFPTSLILVLGYTLSERFAEAIREKIELILYDLEGLREIEACAASSASDARVHLKIETGTSRQGLLSDHLNDAILFFQGSKHVILAGLSTHFANLEDTTDPEYATLQFQRFEEVLRLFQAHNLHPNFIHSACSAAIILYPDTHGTLVRAGIAMYGIWPSSSVEEIIKKRSIQCSLEPVLAWKTRIAQIKTLPSGTPIGYGLTEILTRQSRIAVLPVGYWDGYDRRLSSKGEVLIGGYRCKVMGRVCMNMCMVDVSAVPNAKKHDEVIILGKDTHHVISADQIASRCGTIPYEILARINPLLPRVIV